MVAKMVYVCLEWVICLLITCPSGPQAISTEGSCLTSRISYTYVA